MENGAALARPRIGPIEQTHVQGKEHETVEVEHVRFGFARLDPQRERGGRATHLRFAWFEPEPRKRGIGVLLLSAHRQRGRERSQDQRCLTEYG